MDKSVVQNSVVPNAQADLLSGVRVLDLSRVLAGPWAGQLLADYGAEVLKVERPESGDDTRGWGPPWSQGTPRDAAYFLCTNRGKRSVAVDIASQEGADQIRAWIKDFDVLIENYKVGQLARYGLDYDSLKAIHPGLIYCAITGYGQTGPDAHRPGYDFAIQAEGGLMSITGAADSVAKDGEALGKTLQGEPIQGEPQKVGVAVVDIMTGVYASTAILAALHRKQRTGQGAYIDCALLDTQIAMLANQASNQLIGGVTPKRMGNAHPNIVPYQVFASQDGHFVLALGNDAQFVKLVDLLGEPSYSTDVRFASNAARVANRGMLVEMLATRFKQHTSHFWLKALEAAGLPCAPIHNVKEALECPQTVQRGMVVTRSKHGVALPLVAAPVVIDGMRPAATLAPPDLNDFKN